MDKLRASRLIGFRTGSKNLRNSSVRRHESLADEVIIGGSSRRFCKKLDGRQVHETVRAAFLVQISPQSYLQK